MSTKNLKDFLQKKGVENVANLYSNVIAVMKPAAEMGMLYKGELLLSQEINSIQTPQLEKQESLIR